MKQVKSPGWKAIFMISGLIIFGFGIFQNSLAKIIGGLGLLFLSALLE